MMSGLELSTSERSMVERTKGNSSGFKRDAEDSHVYAPKKESYE
jgi:hypothetical protein